jgi:hypothetical protein
MTIRNSTILIFMLFSILLLGGCAIASAQPGQQEEPRSIVLTTIAIVNADMGIEVDGERLNYSAAIIDVLDAGYTLVSPAMAESGFESGAYGAVITFPSDVSERILSFNSQQPEKVQLDFKVNPNLTEADYINTYVKIMNLQVSINTTLAHTYVSSIITQFHDAQNHMNAVFQNNLNNLYAIDMVRLPAFSSSLDLDDVPDIPLDPASADTTRHMRSVSGFAEGVSRLYLHSYAAASQQYLSMREGLFTLIGGLENQEALWMGKMAAWAETIFEYGEWLEYYKVDEIKQWHESTSEWYSEAVEWYAGYRVSSEELGRYLREVHDFMDFLRANIDPTTEMLQEWFDSLKPALGMLEDWHKALDEYARDLCDECSNNGLPELDAAFHIPATSGVAPIPSSGTLLSGAPANKWPALPDGISIDPPPSFDSSIVPETIPEKPSESEPPRLEDFWESVEILYAQLSEFDVSEFLSDDVLEQVSMFLAAYESFLEMLSDDLDIQFGFNVLELHDVRRGYINYLAALRREVIQGEADEQLKLRGELDEVISIKEGNNENTHGLLSDFAGMMPESRTQSGLNRDLVSFTVAPFEFITLEMRQALSVLEAGYEHLTGERRRNATIVAAATAMLLIATVTMIATHRHKHKQQRKELIIKLRKGWNNG